MNDFLSRIQTALVRTYERIAAFFAIDVRNVENRVAAIEQRLTTEVATLRQEVEQARTDAASEIRQVNADIAEHLDAIKFISNSERDSAGLRGERPAILKQA